MLTTTGFILILLFGYSKSLSNTRCFVVYDGHSVCFTQPDPLLALSWSSAMEWCKNIGGTLPIIDQQNALYGNVLGYFGLHTETLWLGANFTYDPDNWVWANGSSFAGTFENSIIPGKTHAYIVRNGTDVKLAAAAPTDYRSYLCQYNYYSDYECAYYYQNSYWIKEKCYVKNGYGYTWYSYRYNCYGYFAIIDNLNDFSRWLDDLQTYWIGLRCSWWTWHNTVTGYSYEASGGQLDYLNDLFNGTAQCLASYKDNYGNVYWTNRDCDSNLPFICQSDVYATNPTTASEITTTVNSTFAPTFTTTPINPTNPSAITTTPIYPTFAPTSAPTPIIQTTSSEITITSINPTFAPTSTPIPSTMTSASVSVATTPLPASTSTPTKSPTTASGGDTVSSSTQTATTSALRNSNNESKPEIFGMSMEFFVGLGGGLLLALAAWLALITVYACKIPRGTKIFPE